MQEIQYHLQPAVFKPIRNLAAARPALGPRHIDTTRPNGTSSRIRDRQCDVARFPGQISGVPGINLPDNVEKVVVDPEVGA